MLDSPYRRFVEPILEHIDQLDADGSGGFTTVVLPELAVDHAWQESLHNQSLLALASRLRERDRTVVATYSYRADA